MRPIPGPIPDDELPGPRGKKLCTKNVFVDTSVHVAAKFVYSMGGFRRLADVAAGDLAVLYDTGIDRGEIESNIAEAAVEAANGLKRFQREALALKAVSAPSVAGLFHSLEADRIGEMLLGEFADYRRQARAVDVPLSNADTASLFRRYFERKAPFDDKKKAEFPDAFIVGTLAGWCWDNAEYMYVVSRDKGFRAAAAEIGRGRLVVLESLDAFLDLVVSEQYQAFAIAAQRWLRANDRAVRGKITAAFLNAGFYVEDADGDVEDVDFEGFMTDEPLLVEVDEDEAVFSLAGEITFTAIVSYEDPDSGIYDKEDEVMLYTETKRRRVRRSFEVDVEVRITFEQEAGQQHGDPASGVTGKIHEVALNRGRDFPVSIEDDLVEAFAAEHDEPPDWYLDFLNTRDDEVGPGDDADDRPTF